MASSVEHMVLCQKATSRFQNLVSQIGENRDKARSKAQVELRTSTASSTSSSSRASTSAWMATRDKSPSMMAQRLKERSPSRLKYEQQDPLPKSAAHRFDESSRYKAKFESNEHNRYSCRSLLSPSDAVNRRDNRVVSPSRQLFYKSTTSTSSSAYEKRPAWKF